MADKDVLSQEEIDALFQPDDESSEGGEISSTKPAEFEPIKEQLERGASRLDDELDPNWIKSLKEKLKEVTLTVSLPMAETKNTVHTVMSWQIDDFIPMNEIVTRDIKEGGIVALDSLAHEPLDVLVNGTLVAHGEVVVMNDTFGVRLTDIVSKAERIKRLR